MKVGVFLEQNASVGGGFQQAYSVVRLLRKHPIEGVDYVFFVFTKENEEILKADGIEAVRVKFSIRRLLHRIAAKVLRDSLGLLVPFKGCIDGLLDEHGVDMVYFLTPSSYGMGLERHNYIITLWDQCQRDWPEFPEVYANTEFERREFIYRQSFPKAVAVLVDSPASGRMLHERYGVDLNRVLTAPFFPMLDAGDEAVDVRAKYSIDMPFLFYPAQFWAHKNHVYILDALALMRDSGVGAVFTGSDFGLKQRLIERVREMGLADRVFFPGFVPRADVIAFYRQAVALVMPTYFGQTNIPPLEAFALGCPVCYSDLPGLRDQVGEGAFLIDLNTPESLCKAVRTILAGGDVVERKKAAGKKVLEACSEENYIGVLRGIFESYARLRRCRC
ncbi:MAG: glycosyltransferase family 4 protein [Synergistaceae bacterium]|jgi:glycosyltransferase involved in cell wall biosynthesis|nr:glycosyltransferase family 4 protein [Synergistaceae bacterium]